MSAIGDELSGRLGKFEYGATPTELHITKFSIKRTTGQIDVTSSKQASTGYRKKIGNGFTEFEGTFEGFVEAGVVPPTFGTEVALTLTSDTLRKWAGSGTIVDLSEDVDIPGDNAISFSGSFIGSGAWTLTDTTTGS